MTDPRPARPLRIAHVKPMTLDLFGHRDEEWGTRVRYFLSNIAAAQARQGDRPTVHLLTSGPAAERMVAGVRVRFHRCLQPPARMDVTRRFGRQLSLSMLRAIDPLEADIVHFHGAGSLHLMYGAAAHRARRGGLPLVASDHGPRRGWAVEQRMQARGLAGSAAVLAANADSRDRLAALGVPAARLHICPNGTDPDIFRPGPPRAADGRFRILVVSRLWQDKDPLTMARAVTRVAAAGVAVDLTVVGQGPLRAAVEQALAGTGVAARFIEHIDHAGLADLYRGADAFLITSLREGWNQATMEAMACGLPVVATDIPGIRDGVADAGQLRPPGDDGALADALLRLAGGPHLAADYRQRGLDRAREFTWDAIVARMRGVYLDCLAAPPARAGTAVATGSRLGWEGRP